MKVLTELFKVLQAEDCDTLYELRDNVKKWPEVEAALKKVGDWGDDDDE